MIKMGSDKIDISEEELRDISCEVFGSPDYKAMLEILRPLDGMVRSFHRKLERLKNSKILSQQREML